MGFRIHRGAWQFKDAQNRFVTKYKLDSDGALKETDSSGNILDDAFMARTATANIPSEYLTETEGDGRYIRSAATQTVTGNFTFQNWIRVKNNDGLYFQDRGGGWYMPDTTYIRAYNNKSIYTSGELFGSRFVDVNDNNYYVNPASTSHFNQVRANIFYDRGNTSYYLNLAESSHLNVVHAYRYYDKDNSSYYVEPASVSKFVRIDGNEYKQIGHGNPRNNLGDPTITEMALFDSQFTCKTDLSNDYNDMSDLTFWVQQNDGDAWTEVAVSDIYKKRFLRTNSSNVVIPNRAYKFRVEFNARHYTFANAIYFYWSSNSHRSQVHIWKKRCSDGQWLQHTSATNTVSSWPGHLYLPFSSIAWHETNTTSTGHYTHVRVEFIPEWQTSNAAYADRDINLYGGQVWGGYPSGRRTPHRIDEEGRYFFPFTAYLEGSSSESKRVVTRDWMTWSNLSGKPTNLLTSGSSISISSGTSSGDFTVNGDLKLNGSDSYIWTPTTTQGYTGIWDTANGRIALQYRNHHGGFGIMGASESGTALKVYGKVAINGSAHTGTTDRLTVHGRIVGNGDGLYLNGSNYGDNSGFSVALRNHNGRRVSQLLATTGGGWGNMSLNTYSGNVGIGTLDPEEKLTISSGKIQLTNEQMITWADIGDGTTGRVGIKGNEDTDIIAFRVDNQEKMRLTTTGLGIGTTTPNERLHIAGGNISIDNGYSLKMQNDSLNYRNVLYSSTSGNDLFVGGTDWRRLYFDSNDGFRFYGTGTPVYFGHSTTGKTIYIYSTHTAGQYVAHQWNAGGYNITSPQVPIRIDGTNQVRIMLSGSTKAYFDTTGLALGGHSPSEQLHLSGGNMRVDSGSIYLSQTNSSRKPVNIYQNSYKGAIELQRDGARKVRISSDGVDIGHTFFNGEGVNVGIGTSTPAQKLHVHGHVLLENNHEIRQKDSGGSQRTILELDSSNNFNIGGSYAGATRFMGGGSYTERMRIHSNGYVGIGTDNPRATLQVGVGTSAAGSTIAMMGGSSTGIVNALSLVNATGNSNGRGVRLSFHNRNSWSATGAIQTVQTSNTHAALVFMTYGGSLTERMRISSEGNVGIGVNNPTSKLHVNGRAKFYEYGGSWATHSSYSNFQVDTLINNADAYAGSSIGSYIKLTSAMTGNTGFFSDFRSRAYAENTRGNTDWLVNFYAELRNSHSTNAVSLNNHAGLYVAPLTVGGQVTAHNNYGVYLDVGTAATSNYGVYQRGTEVKNYFQGKVGIGTTAPQQMLHVGGNIHMDGSLIRFASSIRSLTLSNVNGSWVSLNAMGLNIGDWYTAPSYGDIRIGDYDFDVIRRDNTNLLRVKNNGYVGIGSTSPSQKLHVEGNVKATGDYYSGDTRVISNGQWVGSNSGLVGPQGPQGPQGPAGAAGATGAQGPQGDRGPAGADGRDGSDASISFTNQETNSTSSVSSITFNRGSARFTMADGSVMVIDGARME